MTTPASPAGPATLALTSAAELVAPRIVSSEHVEIRLAASPDGTMLLWGSTDRKGGPGGWDIWITRRIGHAGDARDARDARDAANAANAANAADGWSAPEPAPFNSTANDFDPAFSFDGRWVYFFSNRPGGLGGDDIYRAPVTGGQLGAAQHLGPEVNTPGNDWAPAPSPDGTLLLFASNRPGAKHDLMIARAEGDGFAPAEPLPGALNTPDADEFDATFLADGRSIVFARSTDVETAPIDLYFATRGPAGDSAGRGAGYDAGTPLSAAVNVAGGYTLGPSIDPADRSILYFSGARPEAAAGKLDIYRLRYRLDGERPR